MIVAINESRPEYYCKDLLPTVLGGGFKDPLELMSVNRRDPYETTYGHTKNDVPGNKTPMFYPTSLINPPAICMNGKEKNHFDSKYT